ncbi:hypothetical protein MY04_0574 [Flammeovirga sp. MY04]|uniref:hypothetical protein n=1 Tax=Flammeovirga sp. MY04 TaxID=1191459 RepID=UPI0008062ED4|nr:hypothetical protein [Flammeovirga sp. MY04]ANQ47956.1 hypothetical protein MY04_0574 [Flammeovirga sp. MY04]
MKLTKILVAVAFSSALFSCDNTNKIEPENIQPQTESPNQTPDGQSATTNFDKITLGTPTVEDSKDIQLVESNSFAVDRQINDMVVNGNKIYVVDGGAFDNQVVAMDIANGQKTSSFKTGNYSTVTYNKAGLVVVEAGEDIIQLGLDDQGDITTETMKKDNPYGTMFLNYVLVDGNHTYWFDPSEKIKDYTLDNGVLKDNGTLDFTLSFGMNATQDANYIYAYSGDKVAIINKETGDLFKTLSGLKGKVTLAVNSNYLFVAERDDNTLTVYHKTSLKEMALIKLNDISEIGANEDKVVAYSKDDKKVTVFDIQ